MQMNRLAPKEERFVDGKDELICEMIRENARERWRMSSVS